MSLIGFFINIFKYFKTECGVLLLSANEIYPAMIHHLGEKEDFSQNTLAVRVRAVFISFLPDCESI